MSVLLYPVITRKPTGSPTYPDHIPSYPLSIERMPSSVLPISLDELNWLSRQMQIPEDTAFTPSLCLHLMHLSGPGVEIESATQSAAVKLLDILLNNEQGHSFFGRSALMRTRHGIRFASETPSNRSGEAHRDQCLAGFGELGVSLNHPVILECGQARVVDLLFDSIAEFHLGQKELEWTALAYLLYLPPVDSWENRFGERYSFDDLAKELLARPFGESSCFGMHLIYSLTILARVDARTPVLSQPIRTRVSLRLKKLVEVCVATQHLDGSWPLDWHYATDLNGPSPSKLAPPPTPSNRLLAAGHIAEWLLVLPEELQPPPETKRKLASWLYSRLIESVPAGQVMEFCAYTHALYAVRHWSTLAE